jgi:hypothetical protein
MENISSELEVSESLKGFHSLFSISLAMRNEGILNDDHLPIGS